MFGRFPARTESRQDTYLLDPPLPGLSVKIRRGGALEVKVYCGNPGILEVPGRARGRLESWQKWSFPVSPPSPVAVRGRCRTSLLYPAGLMTCLQRWWPRPEDLRLHSQGHCRLPR